MNALPLKKKVSPGSVRSGGDATVHIRNLLNESSEMVREIDVAGMRRRNICVHAAETLAVVRTQTRVRLFPWMVLRKLTVRKSNLQKPQLTIHKSNLRKERKAPRKLINTSAESPVRHRKPMAQGTIS